MRLHHQQSCSYPGVAQATLPSYTPFHQFIFELMSQYCLQIRILLCSTKAASLGLNLTMASRVILLDSWWNGATEDQAIDRCHRLGQTREVHVVKIAMKLSESEDTVEQRIINMQVWGSSQSKVAHLSQSGFLAFVGRSTDSLLPERRPF